MIDEVDVLEAEDKQGMKELFIRSRIYNNLMRAARIGAGFKSCSSLAKASGTSNHTVYGFESFKRSPRSQIYGWCNSAEKIARTLKVLPEDIWPEWMWNVKAKANETELSLEEAAALVGQSTLLALEDPATLYDQKELAEKMQLVLGKLMPREEKILRMRFGIGGPEHTIEEISEEIGISMMRVRQIEAIALRKTRHPSRAKMLRTFLRMKL